MIISSYIELGFDHILNIQGYDHILFVIVLCVAYRVQDWKKMLVLITAFTIGHCLTLALAGLEVVAVDAELIEFLIPLTIIFSAGLNIWEVLRDKNYGKLHYILALGFGLIHGLGFSNFFKALVSPDESIIPLLLSFNIGVELGQIVVVVIMFILAYALQSLFKVINHRNYSFIISIIVAVVALLLMLGIL